MSSTLIIVLSCLVAYLTGSVPTSVWLGKARYGIDVRQHGSGNAGATNTFRVLGKKAGIFVLIIDALKGSAAVGLALILSHRFGQDTDEVILTAILAGAAAVIGHIFPIYAGFRGGKGIATLLGIMAVLHWQLTLICIGIFLITLLVSKYVSLGSMLAALFFFGLQLLPQFYKAPSLLVFSGIVLAGVLFTHRANIRRLAAGNENKTYLFRGKLRSTH